MKIKKCVGIVLIFGLITLVGWSGAKAEPAQEAEQPVLKSYIVPERLVMEIYHALSNLLAYRVPRIGQVSITPDGQLLIIAPKSFHDGVEDFIEQLEKNNPAPPPTVEVNYWIVAGREAKTPAKLDEFNRIKPALETIQNNQGNTEFKLLDHLAVTSSSQGTPTTILGALGRIKQEVSAFSDGTLVINPVFTFQEMLPPNNDWRDKTVINTQIEMKSGELVVLGQSSREFIGKPIFEPGKEGEKHIEIVNVYYIISADMKK